MPLYWIVNDKLLPKNNIYFAMYLQGENLITDNSWDQFASMSIGQKTLTGLPISTENSHTL